jgi:hypothetical protein
MSSSVDERWPSALDPNPARRDTIGPVDAARVSLLRWLRRQLQQPAAIREHLEAAVEHDDPSEARRLLEGLPFSDGQRRYVDDVIGAWERTKAERDTARV